MSAAAASPDHARVEEVFELQGKRHPDLSGRDEGAGLAARSAQHAIPGPESNCRARVDEVFALLEMGTIQRPAAQEKARVDETFAIVNRSKSTGAMGGRSFDETDGTTNFDGRRFGGTLSLSAAPAAGVQPAPAAVASSSGTAAGLATIRKPDEAPMQSQLTPASDFLVRIQIIGAAGVRAEKEFEKGWGMMACNSPAGPYRLERNVNGGASTGGWLEVLFQGAPDPAVNEAMIRAGNRLRNLAPGIRVSVERNGVGRANGFQYAGPGAAALPLKVHESRTPPPLPAHLQSGLLKECAAHIEAFQCRN